MIRVLREEEAMKVLIADKVPERSHMTLRAQGCEVIYEPGLEGDALGAALERTQAEVLIVRSTKVGAGLLARSAQLGLIVRAGAGTNTIAVAEAADRGIFVANCPGRNAAAVAELAFGLMLAADRQIPNNVMDLRAGRWDKKRYGEARGLKGRTLGLLGLGDIGQAMIPRALGFGLKVVAWSRSLKAEQAEALGVEALGSPIEVAARADVLSVHVALTEATRGFIGEAIFGAMRPGSIFINTSRGEVVDEVSLLAAVRGKGIRCGLDVYQDEPSGSQGAFETALAKEPLVFGTHHIGASTDQAEESVAEEAARIVLSFKARGEVPNCVNLCTQSPATHVLVVRHRDEVGVLAGVFDVLRTASINVQEMENVIFDGARAAVARVRLESAPDAETLSRIERAPHVLAVGLLRINSNG